MTMKIDSVSDVDPIVGFLRECEKKHRRGEEEYRPDGGPFIGDLFQEYSDEQLDSKNYLDMMLNSGMISQEEYDYAWKIHFQAHFWIQSVRARR